MGSPLSSAYADTCRARPLSSATQTQLSLPPATPRRCCQRLDTTVSCREGLLHRIRVLETVSEGKGVDIRRRSLLLVNSVVHLMKRSRTAYHEHTKRRGSASIIKDIESSMSPILLPSSVTSASCHESLFEPHRNGQHYLYQIQTAVERTICALMEFVFDSLLWIHSSCTDNGKGLFIGQQRCSIASPHRQPEAV